MKPGAGRGKGAMDGMPGAEHSESYMAEALGGGATSGRPALSGCYEDELRTPSLQNGARHIILGVIAPITVSFYN